MFYVQITLACDRCEDELYHELDATELASTPISWSAESIVVAAAKLGWGFEEGDRIATCPTCLSNEEDYAKMKEAEEKKQEILGLKAIAKAMTNRRIRNMIYPEMGFASRFSMTFDFSDIKMIS